jgi:hypothetical protein
MAIRLLLLIILPGVFFFSKTFSAEVSTPRKGFGGLEAVALTSIRDSTVSPLGEAAFSIRPSEWNHAETENFVYHYFHSFIATPVSVESEFYYRITAEELHRDTQDWQRKCHIFVFEESEDWDRFKQIAALDPWTGGVHSKGELFIIRNPKFKYKGDTLGHEIAHLVLFRFFGPGVPLWLNEGFAQYAASRGYAAFYRARGYLAKPTSRPVPPHLFIPLAELLNAQVYPREERAVVLFYIESEKLVRFLAGINAEHFSQFLDCMARGNRFDAALQTAYGSRFTGLTALEEEFSTYASKDYDD